MVNAPQHTEEELRARKQEIRRSVRSGRRERYGTPEGARLRQQEGRRLLRHARELIDPLISRGEVHRVALFHPTPTEPAVMPIVQHLHARGAEVLFPVSAGEELEWVLWDGGPFSPSHSKGFGREPAGERLGPDALATADLVLSPGVAVDRSGTRIGHGAGFYDRALTYRRPGVPVIAVVHPHEVFASDTIPREDFDVPMDAVLTAEGHLPLPVDVS